jgi:hypothetical protein
LIRQFLRACIVVRRRLAAGSLCGAVLRGIGGLATNGSMPVLALGSDGAAAQGGKGHAGTIGQFTRSTLHHE